MRSRVSTSPHTREAQTVSAEFHILWICRNLIFFPRPRDQKRKKQHKNTREHLRCSPTPRRDRKKPTSRISLSIRCWSRRPKNDILPVARFKMKSAAVSTKASNLCQLFYVFIFNEDASNVGRVPRSKKGPKYISSTYFQANCLSDSVPVIPVFLSPKSRTQRWCPGSRYDWCPGRRQYIRPQASSTSPAIAYTGS